MKIAYLDTFAGISGDMTVGALVALGVPLDAIREALAALPISGYRVETRRVERSGIAAVKFDVVVEGDDHAHEHGHAGEGGHAHAHR
ncbi:MAG TPA: nickel insertion protein, partial [Thermodesulfobacteriota bacterium]